MKDWCWPLLVAVCLTASACRSKEKIPEGFVQKLESKKRKQGLKAVQDVAPAIVSVVVADARGSGVLVDPKGLVLTASHLVPPNTEDARVRLWDGREFKGRLVYADRVQDLALIKIKDEKELPFVKTSDQISFEDWCVTLGRTREQKLGIRVGKVRMNHVNLSPSLLSLESFGFKHAIRDATVHDGKADAGDSGGALINLQGQLVGMTVGANQRIALTISAPVVDLVKAATWELRMRGLSDGRLKPSLDHEMPELKTFKDEVEFVIEGLKRHAEERLKEDPAGARTLIADLQNDLRVQTKAQGWSDRAAIRWLWREFFQRLTKLE